MLIEAAWSYRFPARISRAQLLRQERLTKPTRDSAWKAQERLCRRYRKLARAGKLPTVITAAIARAGGLHLGDRQTGTVRGFLKAADRYRIHSKVVAIHHSTSNPEQG
jgi:hypothetical protein